MTGTSDIMATLVMFLLTFVLEGAHGFVAPLPSMAIEHRSLAFSPMRASGDANEPSPNDDGEDQVPLPFRRALLASTAAAATELVFSQNWVRPGFRRVKSTQFIAALGEPNARGGTGAELWGVWTADPGPRGVPLGRYTSDLLNTDGREKIAPAGWEFDRSDFWLEEHGLIMEAPAYDLLPGRYLVTGGRSKTSVLTVEPKSADGTRRWHLDDGVLYDVTHLPCRSARYIVRGGEDGSPEKARRSDFPVKPGAEMPPIDGCAKQDYAVLFVTGVEST